VAVSEVHNYPCPSCGADLLFEPRDGFLTCPYCGHKEAVAQSEADVTEQSFEQQLRTQPADMTTLAANALEVQCQSCGAKSIFTPPEVAGRCEFCGVQIVTQPKSADPIVTHEAIVMMAKAYVGAGDPKAALVSLIRVLALELEGAGVTVNGILPGTIDTPANRESMPHADRSTWVKPESIAQVLVWLMSDNTAAINGALIPVGPS